MAQLAAMPFLQIDETRLAEFGRAWKAHSGALSRTPPFSSGELGRLFDTAVANALAAMLGSVPIVTPKSNDLIPRQADCVELGEIRIIGGVRPQNFDVGYRPDGVRFVFDSKTLNDAKSVGKNWQNMVNDLATEATTVHVRFPFAVVAFLIAIPCPCLAGSTRTAMIGTLERLAGRAGINDPTHMAEAIALVVWDPETGKLDHRTPGPASPLHLGAFRERLETAYTGRYKGLPPHAE